MIAEIVAGLEHASQALVVGDVVTNQESRAHESSRQQWNILGNFASQRLRQQPRLQLQGPPVADFVVEQRVGD